MHHKISRRQLLKITGMVVGGTVGGSVLAGCGAPESVAITSPGAVSPSAATTASTAAASAVDAASTASTASAAGAAQPALPADALPLDQQVWKQGVGQTGGGFGHIMESLYNRAFEHNGYGESLTTLDYDLNVQGVGAESWAVSADGLAWDFKLRQGLMFSDGRPVTAQDWVYTLRRSLANKYDFGWFYFDIKNAGKVAEGQAKPEELGIEAVDEYTLRITTEAPTPYLPALGVWFVVAPDQAWETLGENWALDPAKQVSSGPFILRQFERGVRHSWGRNEQYSGPRQVYFNEIQETTLPTGLPAYMAGDLQGLSLDAGTPAGEVELVKNHPVLSTEQHPQPGSYTDYLGFNTLADKFKPLDNPDVRLALCMALDKKQLVSEIFRGFADPAWGILPKGFPNYIGDQLKGLDPNKYDPEAARQLLSKAGYADGAGFPRFELWLRQPTPIQSALGQAIQAR